MSEVIAYLGMGTNLGDRWANLRGAAELLAAGQGLRVLRCSGVYETEPWGVADQPRFLNCVVEVAVTLPLEELLERCKEVEASLGREPGIRWGPRLIDVDILLYGNQTVDLPHLEIPHPRLHLRAFALEPLSELAPDIVHPTLGLKMGDLALEAEGREGVALAGSLGLALPTPEC